jgi:hypothetical protein
LRVGEDEKGNNSNFIFQADRVRAVRLAHCTKTGANPKPSVEGIKPLLEEALLRIKSARLIIAIFALKFRALNTRSSKHCP